MNTDHSVTAAQFPTYHAVDGEITEVSWSSSETILELSGATGCQRLLDFPPVINKQM
jgi:hypothetical protein